MDVLQIILNDLVVIVLSVVGGFFLHSFFPAYLTEKGKNFATKEDIKERREKELDVHNRFDSKLETLRSQLDRQLHASKLTFEKEFAILSTLWDAFVDLRDSTPEDPTESPMITEQLKQRHRDRLDRFKTNHTQFTSIFEKHRPFYPQEIYDIVTIYTQRVRMRAILSTQYEQIQASPQTYTAILENNRKEIGDLNEQLCDAIRKRLHPFDATENLCS